MQTRPQDHYIDVSAWSVTSLHPARGGRGAKPLQHQHTLVDTELPQKYCQPPCCSASLGCPGPRLALKEAGKRFEQVLATSRVSTNSNRREREGRKDWFWSFPFFPSKNHTVHFDTKQKLTGFPYFLSLTTIPALQPAPSSVVTG